MSLDLTESFGKNLFNMRLKFTWFSAMRFLSEDREVVLQ